MSAWLYWCFHIWLSIHLGAKHSTGFFWGSEGTLSVSSSYVLIGDSFTLTCRLDENSEYNVSTLCFITDRGKNFSDSEVSLLDNKTSSITVTSGGREKDGVTYRCYAQCYEGSRVMIGSNIIYFEYPPQMITDFKCIRRNWSPIECEWHHPIQYIVSRNIQVDLTYASNKGSTGSCPQLVNNTKCIWSHERDLTDQFVYINVTVTNKKANKYVTYQSPRIYRNEIVKPDPPDAFMALASGSRCILLSWSHKATSSHLLFTVLVYSISGQMIQEVNISTETTNEVVQKVICDLHPFTHYSMSIRCVPLVAKEPVGYWSESSTSSVMTDQAVPSGAPSVLPGLYTSGDCANGTRQVSFNWKDVDASKKNGNLTGYRLWACSDDEAKVCLEDEASPGDTYTSSLILQCDKRYKVQITAQTSVGFSEQHSLVYVEKSSEELMQPTHLVVHTTNHENKLNSVSLRWMPEKNNNEDSENVVVWCEKDIVTYACKGPINWRQCGKAASVLIDIVNPFTSMFGVYTRSPGKSSGIVWTHCIYLLNSTDVKPPSNFDVVTSSEARSLTVTWTPPDCTESKAYITHYSIKYCAVGDDQRCKDQEIVIEINSEDTVYQYTINELEPDTKYRITMSSSGHTARSFETEPLFGTPIDNKFVLEGSVIAAIVLGCIAAVVIGVIVLVVILRYSKRGIQKFNRPINFNIPQIFDDDTGISPRVKIPVSSRSHSWDSSGIHSKTEDSSNVWKDTSSKITTTTMLSEVLPDTDNNQNYREKVKEKKKSTLAMEDGDKLKTDKEYSCPKQVQNFQTGEPVGQKKENEVNNNFSRNILDKSDDVESTGGSLSEKDSGLPSDEADTPPLHNEIQDINNLLNSLDYEKCNSDEVDLSGSFNKKDDMQREMPFPSLESKTKRKEKNDHQFINQQLSFSGINAPGVPEYVHAKPNMFMPSLQQKEGTQQQTAITVVSPNILDNGKTKDKTSTQMAQPTFPSHIEFQEDVSLSDMLADCISKGSSQILTVSANSPGNLCSSIPGTDISNFDSDDRQSVPDSSHRCSDVGYTFHPNPTT